MLCWLAQLHHFTHAHHQHSCPPGQSGLLFSLSLGWATSRLPSRTWFINNEERGYCVMQR